MNASHLFRNPERRAVVHEPSARPQRRGARRRAAGAPVRGAGAAQRRRGRAAGGAAPRAPRRAGARRAPPPPRLPAIASVHIKLFCSFQRRLPNFISVYKARSLAVHSKIYVSSISHKNDYPAWALTVFNESLKITRKKRAL